LPNTRAPKKTSYPAEYHTKVYKSSSFEMDNMIYVDYEL